MKREFKKGEEIFAYNYLEPDLNGFGIVLKDTITEQDSDIVYIEVNSSGENEETADRIYKIADNRLCAKCGGVICYEHNDTLWDYPYYCPRCNENLFEAETKEMDKTAYNLHFVKSILRSLEQSEIDIDKYFTNNLL